MNNDIRAALLGDHEAAIKSCEDRIKSLESAPPHYYGKRQRKRAIELEKVKIKALRPATWEQVEKVWKGCDLCTLPDGSKAKMLVLAETCDGAAPFCPLCGRPITDEAVEMVMERLEALNEV